MGKVKIELNEKTERKIWERKALVQVIRVLIRIYISKNQIEDESNSC